MSRPIEAYRRAREELGTQAAVVLQALRELDADDGFRAVAELEELFTDVLEHAEAIEASLPWPKMRVDVPTGGYL